MMLYPRMQHLDMLNILSWKNVRNSRYLRDSDHHPHPSPPHPEASLKTLWGRSSLQLRKEHPWTSRIAQMVNKLPAMQKTLIPGQKITQTSFWKWSDYFSPYVVYKDVNVLSHFFSSLFPLFTQFPISPLLVYSFSPRRLTPSSLLIHFFSPHCSTPNQLAFF